MAFASRWMNETEQYYERIEKEALAVVWACDKFSWFVKTAQSLILDSADPILALLNY